MARLEYRLLDETNGFPIVYYYDNIDKIEIAVRFTCDYFIKNAVAYAKTSCAVEPGINIVYVDKMDEAVVATNTTNISQSTKGIRMELRHFKEDEDEYPIIHTFEFVTICDLLLYLQSDFHYWLGQEWRKSSTEIDEDRKVYVYYAIPSV